MPKSIAESVRKAFVSKLCRPMPKGWNTPPTEVSETQKLTSDGKCIHHWILTSIEKPGEKKLVRSPKMKGVCKFCREEKGFPRNPKPMF